MQPTSKPHLDYIVLVIAILLGSFLFGYFAYRYHQKVLGLLSADREITLLNKQILDARKENMALAEELAKSKDLNSSLSDTLSVEQSRNGLFETQIQAITGTVGTLQKLKDTDKELLQKYSKIYFLNENYIPSSLTAIATSSVYESSRVQLYHAKALPFLEAMMSAASATNTPLLVISAYRSFGEQSILKANYKMTYGSGANKFSADQGYSEHQLGTAVDLTTPALGSSYTKFASSKAYQWLIDNAYKFGFVLSYPKENTYYQFEPWHWRFVGVELATKIHDVREYFYEVPQREIDSYLVNIFDDVPVN